MSRVRVLVATAIVIALGVAGVVGVQVYRRVVGLDRSDRQTPEQISRRIAALDAERADLHARLERLLQKDPRLDGMPEAPVRVAVPTSLARALITRMLTGLADRVTLEFRDLRVRRQGTVRRVVPLGDYDLTVTVTRVRATLTPGPPQLTFGGNRVGVAMPLTLGGTGQADVDFTWDGRTVGGAICGDMHVTRAVTGTVVPRSYPVSGAVWLASTGSQIEARPVLPRLQVRVDVAPSAASWNAMQQILDEKRGLCGFVLDRVDIMGAVKGLVDRGFMVRIPTERVRPVALPVAVEPTMMVRGQPLALGLRVDDLVITEHALWLGVHLAVTRERTAATTTATAGASTTAVPRPAGSNGRAR
jgi:hypothetical protein